MPGLVPGIHVFMAPWFKDVDGRNKCGHDVRGYYSTVFTTGASENRACRGASSWP